MRKLVSTLGGIVAIAAFLVYNSAFVINEAQQVLVLQFGELKRTEREPGLNWKVPFIQNVVYLEKRQVSLDPPEQQIISANEDILFIDAFAIYQIKDPLKYYTGLPTPERARNVLTEIFLSQLQFVIGEVNSGDLIKEKREDVMRQISELMNSEVDEKYGIVIQDARIQSVNFSQKVRSRIYRNMIVEQLEKANSLRSNGERQALDIRSTADKEVEILKARARATAEQLRADGEAERNALLAEAFAKDIDFFNFLESLRQNELALSGQTTILLSPDSDFFRYLTDSSGRKSEAALPGSPILPLQ